MIKKPNAPQPKTMNHTKRQRMDAIKIFRASLAPRAMGKSLYTPAKIARSRMRVIQSAFNRYRVRKTLLLEETNVLCQAGVLKWQGVKNGKPVTTQKIFPKNKGGLNGAKKALVEWYGKSSEQIRKAQLRNARATLKTKNK